MTTTDSSPAPTNADPWRSPLTGRSKTGGGFLPEHTTATSILDRLLHHATIVVTNGDSYRMKHRTEGPTTT